MHFPVELVTRTCVVKVVEAVGGKAEMQSIPNISGVGRRVVWTVR